MRMLVEFTLNGKDRRQLQIDELDVSIYYLRNNAINEISASDMFKIQRIFQSDAPKRFVLISPMRNEGPYILEWLAWHRALGFSDILIVTNDCTDGSGILLKHLVERKLVSHAEHSPQAGKFALLSAFTTAYKHPVVTSADWVMIMDSDEFLVIHVGDHTIQALISENGQECLGMAIHWKCFGDSGQTGWSDGMVRETFTKCGESNGKENRRFKSIFKDPTMFAGFLSHTPRDFLGSWGGDNRWVDSNGRRLNLIKLKEGDRPRSTKQSRITHEVAQINHYVIKSQECLLERREKWKSSNRYERYNEEFLSQHNQNTEEDFSAMRNTERFDEEYQNLVNDAETLRLHHACCAAYVAELSRLAGSKPEDDPRYQLHLAKSQ